MACYSSPLPMTQHLVTLSLSCSRCQHLISMDCANPCDIVIQCTESEVLQGTYDHLAGRVNGCPNYSENIEKIKSCLPHTEVRNLLYPA